MDLNETTMCGEGRARGKAKVVSNEEDKELTLLSDAKVGVDDNVERVRRYESTVLRPGRERGDID